MNKELLKQILLEQREVILNKDFGIERQVLADLSEKVKLPFVHIITGIRRCGKSTLLRQIIKRYFNDSDFYYINFEDERLFNFKAQNFNDLFEILVELFSRKSTFFIDEIQNVNDFEIFVRRFSENGYKFFLTGSNARLLSHEISTKLTGRHLDTYLTPFSFDEYLHFKNYQLTNESVYKSTERAVIKRHFSDFLKLGGMPEYLKFREPEIIQRTYEDILIKDIAVRYKIGDLYKLQELSQYLISNAGRKTSYNSLKQLLDFGSVNTVRSYIQFLENSYLIKQIGKFDYSFKKQLTNGKKIYVVDNGFISNISVSFSSDKGWLIENILFNYLSVRYDVYFFPGKNECDFICVTNKKVKKAIQVTFELNESNKNREMNGLLEAMTFFGLKKGYIVTYDTEDEINIDDKNIIIIPLWKCLLQPPF